MPRRDYSHIVQADLDDGGEIVVQFNQRDDRCPSGMCVGFVVKDRDGFVRTFDAELDPHVSVSVFEGGARAEHEIAKAIFACFEDSQSDPPADGIRAGVAGTIRFGLNPHLPQDASSASTEALEWRMNNPLHADAASSSWIRSNPELLGMQAPGRLVRLSADTWMSDARKRGCLRRAILTFPVIVMSRRLLGEIVRRVEDGMIAGRDVGLRDMASACSDAFGMPVPVWAFSAATMLNTTSSKASGSHIERFLRVAVLLPASWMPKDDAGSLALDRLIDVLNDVIGPDAPPADVAALLAHSAGRWVEFLRSFNRERSEDAFATLKAMRALTDVSDYLDWIADNLVSPFVSFGSNDDSARRRTALGLVTDGGGIRSVFTKSEDWHNAPATPTTRVVAPEDVKWKGFVSGLPRKGSDGAEIRELLSIRELADEGRSLGHCVGAGGFAERCFQGRTRIVSVRNGGESLSTAEISFDTDGRPLLVQHRGNANASPCSSSERVLSMLFEDIGKGALRVTRPGPQEIPDVEYDLDRVTPSDFRKYLRRDLSRLDWDDFAEVVIRAGEAAAPGVGRIVERTPPAPRF